MSTRFQPTTTDDEKRDRRPAWLRRLREALGPDAVGGSKHSRGRCRPRNWRRDLRAKRRRAKAHRKAEAERQARTHRKAKAGRWAKARKHPRRRR